MKIPAVKLISITPEAEKIMAYVARVSNPNRSLDTPASSLLNYCINHKHWSVFESAYMTVEIKTTVAISRQILRHKSFSFQEFSQRYAEADLNFPPVELRGQDSKNRQNSLDNISSQDKLYYQKRINALFNETRHLYQDMLSDGIAKECARSILPMATPTTLHMTGNCRQWIHYIQLRESNGTQLEHQQVAQHCKKIFVENFPLVSEALSW